MQKVSSFSERLKEATKNMSGIEVSELLGVSRSTVSFYLSGYRTPREPAARYMADRLGVSQEWLLGYDVPMTEGGSVPIPQVTQKVPKQSVAKSTPVDDEYQEYLEVKEIRELLRERPECKMLFSIAKDATPEDIRKAVSIIEVLRRG